MIEVETLTKRFGRSTAVDRLSFMVRPGAITGFLGPTGAGKSTTLRMILALTTPTGGRATVNGRAYRSLRAPLREVGALLDPGAAHGGRTAAGHLRWLAASNGLPRDRVADVLAVTGLDGVADRRIRGFSLGMRQRLGLAAALLGDPPVLILDEPVNGLDPEGVHWLRRFLTGFAAAGRTVLISSHLISELALSAQHLVIIGRGRLLADTGLDDLTRDGRSLEDAYLALTAEAVEYRSGAAR